jgi:hypothetical protein
LSRFSQLYIDTPAPLSDDPRARRRLAKLVATVFSSDHETHQLTEHLEQELGVEVSVIRSPHWTRFFSSCNLRDFLDAITLVYDFDRKNNLGQATRWREQARRIFSEERLAYAIDDKCVVHPAVDQEFQRNRHATVVALQLPRYANSLAAFERVSDELSAQPPNGKDAWRAVFSALEGLFKLMFPSVPRLTATTANAQLAPMLQRLYVADPIAMRAAAGQLAAFRDWVDASHNYRHEQGSEEPIQPPIDLAILSISTGAAYLRWLITIDQNSMTFPN